MQFQKIQKNKPAIILAPMEGITDVIFREVLTSFGGYNHCVTEFIRVSQEPLPAKVFKRKAPELLKNSKTKSGIFVQVQLLGGHPERVALSAKAAVEAGALAVDLNFGCPAPTVNKNDGGASLLRDPKRLEQIIREVKSIVPKNVAVSAKLRLGWDNGDDIFNNIVHAAQGGADWITIHARTRMQGYMPPAYWQKIGEAKKQVDVPVVANGEIWTVDDFKRCQEITGCEHFMLGRGALADPLLVLKVLRHENQNNSLNWVTLIQMLSDTAKLYLNDEDYSRYTLKRSKQWLKYAKMSMDYQKIDFKLFDHIKKSTSIESLFSILHTG